MRFLESKPKQLVLEDEGRNIGSVNMSKPLFDFFKSGERIVLETSLQNRIAITLNEYVIEAQKEYPSIEDWEDFMLAALQRIQKRLGGERHHRVMQDFNQAMQEQRTTESFQLHERWIETLLVEYYDPMYDHQMQKNQHKVTFSGSQQEVIDYLNLVNA